MNSCDSGIPNTIDNVTHRFGSQRGFFGDGNIARARGHDRDRADPLVRFVAANSYETRRFVPLGVCNYVAYLAKRSFVGACDEDVWRALCESFDDADDLSARLAATEDYFRKALPRRARVPTAAKPDAFDMKVLDTVYGVLSFQLAALVRRQQLSQFVQIHRQEHATQSIQTKPRNRNLRIK